MAEHGTRVLVIEREAQFHDRIRGEVLSSWGVAETQALGLYALLRNTCAHESPRFGTYLGPEWQEPPRAHGAEWRAPEHRSREA